MSSPISVGCDLSELSNKLSLSDDQGRRRFKLPHNNATLRT